MKSKTALAYLAWVALAFAACAPDAFSSLGDTERLRVVLPEPHPAITARAATATSAPTWTVYWYDGSGVRQSASGVAGETEITVETGLFTPIIAVPETDGTGIPPGTLPRAGSLYPAGARADGEMPKIELSWLSGIAAECAETACLSARGGFATGRTIAAHFNWQRFTERIGALKDPSAFDRKRVIAAILSGDVDAWDIAKLKTAAVRISLPAGTVADGSRFFAGFPPAPGFSWKPEGVEINRPDGPARFFCPTGYLTLEVTGGKASCAFFTPYDLQD
jgi:hypothetical protein